MFLQRQEPRGKEGNGRGPRLLPLQEHNRDRGAWGFSRSSPLPIGNLTYSGVSALIAVFQILQLLLNVIWWIIIVQAILSWLIAFNVINTGSDLVRSIWTALQRMTEPLYRPIRRILPDFGALDLSPLVVLLLLAAANIVLNNLAASYIASGGGY